MRITIKQTIDPAILDKELDDGMGTSKAIIALKTAGICTLRTLLLTSWSELGRCGGIGATTFSNIVDWVWSKKLPWPREGVSPTLLSVLSKTADYKVSLEDIGKLADEVLIELAEKPNYAHSRGINVPIIADDGSVVGTVRINIKMNIE